MSSVQTVTEPAAVRLLLRGRARQVLGAFLDTEAQVAQVARGLKVDIRAVHREVQALLGAGLLRVVRQERRAGRAIKVYAASAPAYFVPFSATDATTADDLLGGVMQRFQELFAVARTREFGRAEREQAGGREWGVRLFRAPDGRVLTDTAYEGAALLDPLARYQGPRGLFLDVRTSALLTPAEAEQVQRELTALLSRLRRETPGPHAAGVAQPYLLQVGLMPVTPEEHAQMLTQAGQGAGPESG